MRTFTIYFVDLNSVAQKQLCGRFNTSPEKENWDTIPLATIEREEEGD